MIKGEELKPMPKFAQELRIDNYYRWLHEDDITYHRVDLEFIKNQLAYEADPNSEEFCRGWWATPIPLTPELLLKCGFENRYGNDYFYKRLKFSYEINELSQFVRFHYSGKVTYLQSLHQLQNLVYILTNTELQINL